MGKQHEVGTAGMPQPDSILRAIEDRSFRLGVIGLGYVGLPLMLAAVDNEFRVLGFDIDQLKVERLNAGHSPLKHVGPWWVAAARDAGLFKATADFSRVGKADGLVICVPTPLDPHHEPDLSFIEGTGRACAPTSASARSWCSNRRSGPAPRARYLSPSLRAPACARRSPYSSPTRLSARTRATSSSRPTASPRSSAATGRSRSGWPWRSTARSWCARCRSPRRTWPRRSSSPRTSSAR